MAGKEHVRQDYHGVVRTTYLIDEDGVITKAFGKVKAAENPEKMLAEI